MYGHKVKENSLIKEDTRLQGILKERLKKEYDVNLFFYPLSNNANNLCGMYNIFLNEEEPIERIFDLLRMFLIQIEKDRKQSNFGHDEKIEANILAFILQLQS